MRLESVLIKSKVLPDPSLTMLFFDNRLIYLNASPCTNGDITLVRGDFVQFVVHNKYYILYKWLANTYLQKRLSLKSKIYTKMQKKRNTQEDKQKSSILPHWVLNNKIYLLDTPNYLEVDYFTLSFFLVYEPFMWSDIDPYYFINLRSTVLNMYNWKYLN
jgi:hypothetical protein